MTKQKDGIAAENGNGIVTAEKNVPGSFVEHPEPSVVYDIYELDLLEYYNRPSGTY